MAAAARLDTRLESEAAEFLVLGNLLLARIPSYKTYTNMPGYDLVATNPERNTSAKIQVKSRWRTNAPGFPIKNFGCDFVVFCRLNRGSKKGTAVIRAPEYYVFPVQLVRSLWRADDPWGKIALKKIDNAEQYLNRWDLIRAFLAGEVPVVKQPHPGSAATVEPPIPPPYAGPAVDLTTFRERASSLHGQELATRRGRKFVVYVDPRGLEIVPASTGAARRVGWKRIEVVLNRFNEIRSFVTTDYQDSTHDASYMLTIIQQLFPK